MGDQFFCFLVFHELWECQIRFLDGGIYRIGIVFDCFSKWEAIAHKFIEDTAKRPNINFKGIAISFKNFRRHVMRGTNDGKSLKKVLRGKLLGSPHIYQMHLALRIHDRVLRFEISVNDAVGVKVLD